MAVAVVGGGTADVAASDADTTLTLGVPGSAVNGDLLIAIVVTYVNVNGYVNPVPTGWTAVQNSAAGLLSVFTKVASSSEPASYDFTGNTYWQAAGCIVAMSGADAALTVSSQTARASWDATIDYTSATVSTGDGVLWVYCRNKKDSPETVSSISRGSATELANIPGSSGTPDNQSLAIHAEGGLSASTISGVTGTLSGDTYEKYGYSVVVPAAAAAGATIPIFLHHYQQQGAA